MANNEYLNIADFVSKSRMSVIRRSLRENFDIDLEVLDVNANHYDGYGFRYREPHFCHIIKSDDIGKSRCRQERIRALNIAIETGQPYIALCHAGIVFVCVPLMDDKQPLGGIMFGRSIWSVPDETFNADIIRNTADLDLDAGKLLKSVSDLKTISARRIHEAAEYVYVLFYQISGLDPNVVQWRRERSRQQAVIGEYIAEYKDSSKISTAYPYQYEQQLISKVRLGDRIGAKDILNIMLARLMLNEPGDIGKLKARMLELTTVLSRAAADGGVDINILLEKNLANINRLISIDTQSDLCAWVGQALDDFIELVYTSQDSRKMIQIRPAVDFIEKNYFKPISLADVAKAAHLSVSRLSHVFKEHMDMTIVDYVNSVRLEGAKNMLLSTDKSCTEICYEVGFNNQSYFTKCFKEKVGATPKQYRKLNIR
ncbi:HTH-type transcriptional regulator YesS [Limihaloglobus sulfuriphilus]|uniref:HTH-type transcriptional regulator YesS n=1 Tax=Limihaloglobus sulfuriphilus TaxID=1851148 RepID=A0A1Q2MD94_9BACT|nr:helix-turn-helix domain-containing protein [Limihaloglobus sulfuriphilus]AQQ70665.1 HTH-type transcriptional regulator YesS [Limihaloglobus sulfuriphilus]